MKAFCEATGSPLSSVWRNCHICSFPRTRESRLCQIARTFNGQRLGPRVRGDERVENLAFLSVSFTGSDAGMSGWRDARVLRQFPSQALVADDGDACDVVGLGCAGREFCYPFDDMLHHLTRGTV